MFTDGGAHATDGETTAGVVFGPVVATEAHLAHAGAGLHTNNTAELSSIIEGLVFQAVVSRAAFRRVLAIINPSSP